MKITLNDIYAMPPALKKITAQDLPLKVSYKMSKLVKSVDAETALIEAERNKLIQKYGAPDPEDADRIRVEQTKLPEFLVEWQEFLKTEIEVEWEPISVEAFGESVKLSTQDVMQLSSLLTD